MKTASKLQQPAPGSRPDRLLPHWEKSTGQAASAAYCSPCPFYAQVCKLAIQTTLSAAGQAVVGTPEAVRQPPGMVAFSGTAVLAAPVGEAKIGPAVLPGQFLDGGRGG
jgi:hypothetical protein